MTDTLDLTARFAPDGTLSISGSPPSLLALGRMLEAGDSVAEVVHPPSLPEGAAAVRAIDIRVGEESGVSITRERDAVVVAGHPLALAILADNIARLGSDPAALGGHIHIEYFPDHAYLRAGSMPLYVEAT